MATDRRLFEPQLAALPNLRVPNWIEPRPRESLRAYAGRMARAVDPGGPCVVGGASFGGAVAREMAHHLQTDTCILIGSLRSSDELPWQWRAFRPLAALGPGFLGWVAGMIARVAGPWLKAGRVLSLRRLAGPKSRFVRWAMCAVVGWRPSPAARRVRVFQIHGEADRTLPVSRTRPDVVVPNGAHALPLTSPDAVTEFIRRCVDSQ
jgi:pimeloyl-ACP methyl ester carboxylesterase